MQWEKKKAFLCEHKNYVINCLSRRRLFFLLACLEISEWRHVLLPCHLIKKDKDDSLNFPWRNSWVARINATIIIQIIVTFFTLRSPWRTANDSLESAKILWSFTRNFPRFFTTLSGRLWKRMSGVARPEFCEHKSIRLHTSKRFPFKLSSRTIFSLFFSFCIRSTLCNIWLRCSWEIRRFTRLIHESQAHRKHSVWCWFVLWSSVAHSTGSDGHKLRKTEGETPSFPSKNNFSRFLSSPLFYLCFVSFHFFSSVKMWLQAIAKVARGVKKNFESN